MEGKKASDFLSKIARTLEEYDDGDPERSSPWIFGTRDATALDSHVAPFIGRLIDVGRESMLGGRVQAYAVRVFGLPIWENFMAGRRTVFIDYI